MDSELHCGAACAKTCDLVNVTVLNFWVKNCIQQSFLRRAELLRPFAVLSEEARLHTSLA